MRCRSATLEGTKRLRRPLPATAMPTFSRRSRRSAPRWSRSARRSAPPSTTASCPCRSRRREILPPPERDFFARTWDPKSGPAGRLPAGVRRLVRVHRLREVLVQVGFTRLEAPAADLQGEYDLGVKTAPLTRGAEWLPAAEIHGEGLFIQLDPDRGAKVGGPRFGAAARRRAAYRLRSVGTRRAGRSVPWASLLLAPLALAPADHGPRDRVRLRRELALGADLLRPARRRRLSDGRHPHQDRHSRRRGHARRARRGGQAARSPPSPCLRPGHTVRARPGLRQPPPDRF